MKEKTLKIYLAVWLTLFLASCTPDPSSTPITPSQQEAAVLTVTPIATIISPTSMIEVTPSPDSEATYAPPLPPTPEQTFESDRFEAGPFSFDFRLYRRGSSGR
jgi:hypothetical protein